MKAASRRPSLERRSRKRPRTRLCWAVGVGVWMIGASGCAELLDLPDDPHLTMPLPDSAQTSPLGMVPTDSSNTGGGSVTGEVALDSGSIDSSDASTQPERDLDLSPADVAEPDGGGGVDGPVLPDAIDAGPPSSGSVDAAVIEPTPACADGSVEGPSGNCYVLGSSELGWAEARAVCRERGPGWDLAAVRDVETNQFLAGSFSGEAWLGGSDGDLEGTWRWVRDGSAFWRGDADGVPVGGAFVNWNSDEPNGDDGSDCVRMIAATSRWADLECEELRLSLCEGPKS